MLSQRPAIYQRLLGHPFVYDYVRPLAVGGIDLTDSYANLDVRPTDVVVDIGCGTGDALRYLSAFREFHGFDTDAQAIEAAKRRPQATRSGVHFNARTLTSDDLATIAPNCVMMSGLLHHLSDSEAVSLLELCAAEPSVRRIATNDPVYLPKKLVNNAFARMDRGRHVRDEHGYRTLAERAGLSIVSGRVARCHPRTGLAYYYLMALERSAA